MPIAKSMGAALGETRHAWRDFVELFAIEGRLASLKLVRLIILAILGGLLIVIAWLLLCFVGAYVLYERYLWEWKYILLGIAGIHIGAAFVVVLVVRKTGGQFFFPATLAQIRGLKDQERVPHIGIRDLERERDAIEASLEQAKYDVTIGTEQTKRAFKAWMTRPSVLAGAVLVGYFMVPRSSKNAASATASAGFVGLLLPIILNQVARASLIHFASTWKSRKNTPLSD